MMLDWIEHRQINQFRNRQAEKMVYEKLETITSCLRSIHFIQILFNKFFSTKTKMNTIVFALKFIVTRYLCASLIL